MTNKNYLGQGWLILVLALGFGAALAGVEGALRERIKENKRNMIYDQIPALMPGAVKDKTQEDEIGGKTVYKCCDAAGRQVGWVIRGEGMGFADKIDLLVGLNLEATTITGLFVLDNKETPGLGNKIAPPSPWPDQFHGKTATVPLSVVKTDAKGRPAEIQAISGATISSQSTVSIVNPTVEQFRAALAAEAGKAKEQPHGK